MSSNKYFTNWEKNHKNNNKNHKNNYKNNDSEHLGLVKKLNRDIERLDRTIDKIQTEKKARKIFNIGKVVGNQVIGGVITQPQFIQPIHFGYIEPKYIVVNGRIMMLQDNY